MSDARTGDYSDEDRLPWLEAVEEEEREEGPSVAKMIAWIVIGLFAIAVVVGGLFWAGNRSQPGGNGEIIAAPEGDYKVKPENPGGMTVDGEGDTAFAASEGAEPRGQLDTSAAPETPVQSPARPSPQAPSVNAPAPTAPAPPASRPASPQAAGATIQLGAFSSQASANRAWTALSARFRYLSPLSHNVVPVQTGGRTLYRLRASGPDAAAICRRLEIAGEACSIVS